MPGSAVLAGEGLRQVFGLEPWVLVAVGSAVLVGATTQGLVGLGVGLVAAPATALLAPSLMPGMLLWLVAAMPLVTLLRERDAIDWRGLGWAVPMRVPGTVLGVGLVAWFSDRGLGIAVGLMVLAAVALTASVVTVAVTPWSLMTAGFISGVTGTATSIDGPPLALLYQHREPRQIRCTLAAYFLVGSSLSLAGLALAGSLASRELWVALVFTPCLVLGFVVSRALHRRVDPQRLRGGVLTVCALSALVLVVRSLLG